VKEKYGDDASKRPLFDQDSWVQAVGGKKKGRLYGFNDIRDPHLMMTGIPSTESTSTLNLPERNEEVCLFYISQNFRLHSSDIMGHNC